MRYLLNSWETDLRQGRALKSIIPIVIYHGKLPWEKESMAKQFPQLPKAFLPYLPDFNYEFLSLRDVPDEVLFGMNLGLIRNVFLAMKHAWEDAYLKHHFAQIVIFAEPITQNDFVRFLFEATLLYLKSVSSISQKDFKTMITEKLSPELKKEALTTFEQIMLEGEERGIAKGMEKGMEKGLEKGLEKGKKEVIKSILSKHPDWTDEQISELLDVPVHMIKEVRTDQNA